MMKFVHAGIVAIALMSMAGLYSTPANANTQYAKICAYNNKAGYVGLLLARWKEKESDTYKSQRYTANISSPFTHCVDVPRDSVDTEVEVRMLTLEGALNLRSRGLETRLRGSSSISGCVKNWSKSAHDHNFTFTGTALNPSCKSKGGWKN